MKKLNLLLLLFMFGLVGTMSGQDTFYWSIHPDAGGASLKVIVTDVNDNPISEPVDVILLQGESVMSGSFTVPPFSKVTYFANVNGGRLQCVTTEQGIWTDYFEESIYSPHFNLYDEGISAESKTWNFNDIYGGTYGIDLCIHLFAY